MVFNYILSSDQPNAIVSSDLLLVIRGNFASIIKLLYYCCREGFPSERIEAALHNIELATKHQSSNFGLGLIMVIAV